MSDAPSPPPSRADRKAAARNRILTAAARAVRDHGAEGVGVAAVMREAGLTHGTFYAHFASKEDLVAQAIGHAAETFLADLAARARTRGVAAAYLDPAHVEDRGEGCAVAALGPEASRMEGDVFEAMAAHVERSIATVQDLLGDPPRATAIAGFATVLGGLILARAATDPGQRDEILAACRDALTGREDRT